MCTDKSTGCMGLLHYSQKCLDGESNARMRVSALRRIRSGPERRINIRIQRVALSHKCVLPTSRGRSPSPPALPLRDPHRLTVGYRTLSLGHFWFSNSAMANHVGVLPEGECSGVLSSNSRSEAYYRLIQNYSMHFLVNFHKLMGTESPPNARSRGS